MKTSEVNFSFFDSKGRQDVHDAQLAWDLILLSHKLHADGKGKRVEFVKVITSFQGIYCYNRGEKTMENGVGPLPFSSFCPFLLLGFCLFTVNTGSGEVMLTMFPARQGPGGVVFEPRSVMAITGGVDLS